MSGLSPTYPHPESAPIQCAPTLPTTNDPVGDTRQTRLTNRRCLLERIAVELEVSRHREAPRSLVLVVGLDRLRSINGRLGYEAGDQVLVETARRLASSRRPDDLIANLGGDEFGLVLTDLSQLSEAQRLASELQKRLRWPIRFAANQIAISSCFGMTWIDETYATADEVLRDAEIALTRAKAAGQARIEIFDPQRHGEGVELLKIENDLRGAIDRGELRLHYQPIIDLKSGQVRSFEALVRWNHPRRGLLRPKEFLSLARTLGLMPELCAWTLDQACQQLAKWHRLFPKERWTISVNIDSQHLSEPGFVSRVDSFLQRSGLTADSLNLEITESAMMGSDEQSTAVLNQLRDRGVDLHIDDFGTGYATLSYLYRVPGRAVKIDASFITGMLNDSRHLAIVRSIVDLAHNLGFEVIAEGIETPPQLQALREMGCDRGQGFYFSRPLDPDSLEILLAAGMQWVDAADRD